MITFYLRTRQTTCCCDSMLMSQGHPLSPILTIGTRTVLCEQRRPTLFFSLEAPTAIKCHLASSTSCEKSSCSSASAVRLVCNARVGSVPFIRIPPLLLLPHGAVRAFPCQCRTFFFCGRVGRKYSPLFVVSHLLINIVSAKFINRVASIPLLGIPPT